MSISSEKKMTKFFNNFKNYHPKDWDNKIRSEFNKKEYLNLFSEQEKIKISPFYHNKINLTSNFPNEIINLQLIDATDPKTANQKALKALNTGIDGLCFSNPNNLDILLKNIKTEYIKTNFIDFENSFLKELENFSKKNQISGAIQTNTKTKFKKIKKIVFVKGKTIKDQINYALNEAEKYDEEVEFHFVINKNFFFEIAKLRAFRIIWETKTQKQAYHCVVLDDIHQISE